MWLFVFSVGPLVIFLGLLLWWKMTLTWSAMIAMLVTLFLNIFYWQTWWPQVGNSLVKGVLVAADIFVIVAGAIFFLEIMKRTKVLENIGFYLGSISRDYRVQVIILAWFFEALIEGTAGFGAPVAVVAPVLVGLGLTPLTAVVVGLLGNSVPGVFGAAGTPIRVGLAGLEAGQVPLYAALFNVVGFIVPVFMLWIIVRRQKNKWQQFWEAVPFAVWSGVVFVAASLASLPLGQEFPSIMGAIIGLAVVSATTKWGIFVPRKERRIGTRRLKSANLPPYKVVLPYGALVVLLVAGKYLLGSVTWSLWAGVTYQLNFFNPGLAFVVVAWPAAWWWMKKKGEIISSAGLALKRTVTPFIVIAAMAVMVQLYINSGFNSLGLPSALEVLSGYFANVWLPFMAPFVGAFGSFLTGSVTLSNIMFGSFLIGASESIGVEAGIILALGVVGAAAGNMIALADMLAGEAVVGLKNAERKILVRVMATCVVYVALVGMLGMGVIYVMQLF